MAMGPEQLGQLIDTHGPALILYARQSCDAPEDVVQVAFLNLARQQPIPDNPVAWLYRTVGNGAASAARAARRRVKHERAAASATPVWFAPAEASRLDAATATQMLAELPLEERQTIVAHLWGGLTFEEIGPMLGLSSATAHRRYVAGLSKLRERMGEPCPKSQTN